MSQLSVNRVLRRSLGFEEHYVYMCVYKKRFTILLFLNLLLFTLLLLRMKPISLGGFNRSEWNLSSVNTCVTNVFIQTGLQSSMFSALRKTVLQSAMEDGEE